MDTNMIGTLDALSSNRLEVRRRKRGVRCFNRLTVFLRQIVFLLYRHSTFLRRDFVTLIAMFVLIAFAGLFVGSAFSSFSEDERGYTSAGSLFVMVFFITAIFHTVGTATIHMQPKIQHELKQGLYTEEAYLVAEAIVDALMWSIYAFEY
eukprot:TRINITY_DN4828_c0_g2_i2.p1 TRINITY_DN4828_c0_g2~~TRINITY_DN4828_c0_g2_i2.p1  ORF type:complete len:150 (+),score=24.05 TRINITY_DN4828_c0_g2_i2:71-520(+)